MKEVDVVAAIICSGSKIFVSQRGYGDFKDMWEFPGGKIESGETPEDALVREICEELSVTISVDEWIGNVEYDYPSFHLKMSCFLCSIVSGEVKLNEHEGAKWIALSEINEVNWLPADALFIEENNAKLAEKIAVHN